MRQGLLKKMVPYENFAPQYRAKIGVSLIKLPMKQRTDPSRIKRINQLSKSAIYKTPYLTEFSNQRDTRLQTDDPKI